MKLSPKQGNYYKNSNRKLNIAHGAVRSGKTFIVNLRWLKYVRREAPPGHKLLMSGYSKNTIKENVLEDLESIVGVDNPAYDYKEGMLKLYGRKIEVYGSGKIDSEKAIRGRTYAGWYGDEITLHHPTFVKQAVTRNSVKGSKLFWTTNPDHPKHYIKKQYIDNPDWKDMMRNWHFLLEDNLTLTEEYIMTLKASFSGVFYKRNIDGLWVVADGLVYEDYNPEYRPVGHKIKHEEAMYMLKQGVFSKFIGGIDFGFTHPMVGLVYGVIPNPSNPYEPTYVQIDEFYQTQRQTEDLGRWFLYQQKEVLKKPFEFIYADSAEPDRIMKLRSKAFALPVVKARKDKAAGINSVGTVFKNNRMMISDRCENTDSELQLYRFPNEDEHTKAQLLRDEPLKEDDHTTDAKRYCIHNHEIMLIKLKEKAEKRGRQGNQKRPSQRRR